jgi:hypothetical protein
MSHHLLNFNIKLNYFFASTLDLEMSIHQGSHGRSGPGSISHILTGLEEAKLR